jgi:prepilin-type N-terminal cleavage/methylation domain-containing protein
MRAARRSPRAGFTLVELLVVIAIIGILAAMLLSVLPAVIGSSKGKVALNEIQQLVTALTLYESKFQDYPPTSLAGMKGNGVNEGNESLVACLSTTLQGGPFFEFKEDKLVNADKDRAPKPLSDLFKSQFKTRELFELTDPFGQPYIYFHGSDLAPSTKVKYTLGTGTVTISPAPPGKTGVAPGAGKFQVISAGENAKYDKGDGDDVTSFR